MQRASEIGSSACGALVDKPVSTDMTWDELIHAAANTLPVTTKAEGTPLYSEGDGGVVEFRGRKVRRIFHEDEWWFSVVDLAGAMAESINPRAYWSKLKTRIVEESGDKQLLTEIQQLPMLAEDGKLFFRFRTNFNRPRHFAVLPFAALLKMVSHALLLREGPFLRLSQAQGLLLDALSIQLEKT